MQFIFVIILCALIIHYWYIVVPMLVLAVLIRYRPLAPRADAERIPDLHDLRAIYRD